jgi:hypothetical protein
MSGSQETPLAFGAWNPLMYTIVASARSWGISQPNDRRKRTVSIVITPSTVPLPRSFVLILVRGSHTCYA